MKYIGRRLGALLIEEGLCPPNCSVLELHVPAAGAIVIRYEVYVDTVDLPKIARALTRLAEPEPTP
jgi:hypothetical protein